MWYYIQNRVKLLTALLLALFICGCRTYFGYDDDVKESVTSQRQAEYDHKRNCVLSISNGDARVQLYEQYKLKNSEVTQRLLVGYKHYYANFDSKDTNPALTKVKWFMVTGERFKNEPFSVSSSFMNNVKQHNVPLTRLIGGCMGLCLFGFELCVNLICYPCVDFCITSGQLMWNLFSSPCHWFWTRTFYGFDDWQLKQHKPGILTMLTYMPGINLFFPLLTPPYLNKRAMTMEYEKLSVPQALSSQTLHTVYEKERALAKRKVSLTLMDADAKIFASAEMESDHRGQVAIKEFLVSSAVGAAERQDKFKLLIKVDGISFEKTIPAVACLRKEHLEDFQIFNNRSFDFRRRALAFMRSCKYWRVNVNELLRRNPEMSSLLQYAK